MKQAITSYFKNLREIKELPNNEYELKFPNRVDETLTDTYILEIREIKKDRFILLLFSVKSNTIMFHNQLVTLQYKGEMVNMFEMLRTYNGYGVQHFDTNYLRESEVITSQPNKEVSVKNLVIA